MRQPPACVEGFFKGKLKTKAMRAHLSPSAATCAFLTQPGEDRRARTYKLWWQNKPYMQVLLLGLVSLNEACDLGQSGK